MRFRGLVIKVGKEGYNSQIYKRLSLVDCSQSSRNHQGFEVETVNIIIDNLEFFHLPTRLNWRVHTSPIYSFLHYLGYIRISPFTLEPEEATRKWKRWKTYLVLRTGWTQPWVGVRALFKSKTGEVETVTTSVATQQLSKILAYWADKRESVVFLLTFLPPILLLLLRNGHDPCSSHTCTANLLHCSLEVYIPPCQTPHMNSYILYIWRTYGNKTTGFDRCKLTSLRAPAWYLYFWFFTCWNFILSSWMSNKEHLNPPCAWIRVLRNLEFEVTWSD